jgi:hypothetical protein
VLLMPMRYSELAARVVARRRCAAAQACQPRRLKLRAAGLVRPAARLGWLGGCW